MSGSQPGGQGLSSGSGLQDAEWERRCFMSRAGSWSLNYIHFNADDSVCESAVTGTQSLRWRQPELSAVPEASPQAARLLRPPAGWLIAFLEFECLSFAAPCRESLLTAQHKCHNTLLSNHKFKSDGLLLSCQALFILKHIKVCLHSVSPCRQGISIIGHM